MKNILLLGTVSALFVVATVVSADEISKSRLAALGLSGMQPMSDSEGLAVRGMGFAATGGFVYVKDVNLLGGGVVEDGADYGETKIQPNAFVIGGDSVTADSGDVSGPSWAFAVSGVYAR